MEQEELNPRYMLYGEPQELNPRYMLYGEPPRLLEAVESLSHLVCEFCLGRLDTSLTQNCADMKCTPGERPDGKQVHWSRPCLTPEEEAAIRLALNLGVYDK